MKWIIYTAVLTAALLFRPERTDVAKLQPVEVVMLRTVGSEVVLETDTGDRGVGVTTEEALADLKKTTPGIVYLDTAEYLLVDDEQRIREIEMNLRKTTRMCRVEGELELSEVARFLDVHRPEKKLNKWTGEKLAQVLVGDGNRIEIKKK